MQCTLAHNSISVARTGEKRRQVCVGFGQIKTLGARVHAVPENKVRIAAVRTRVATPFVVYNTLITRRVVETTAFVASRRTAQFATDVLQCTLVIRRIGCF